MIFHNIQAIFFHIPKTAGTSMEWAFAPEKRDAYVTNRETFFGWDKEDSINLQHATPAFMKSRIPAQVFDDYYRFTVVRNPYSRFLSLYHYQPNMFQDPPPTFEEYVQQRFQKGIGTGSDKGDMLTPQSHYVSLNGQPVCHRILYFERLDQDFEALCEDLRVRTALPKHNQSQYPNGKKPVREYYNAETAAMVQELYADDFRLLGYSTDINAAL